MKAIGSHSEKRILKEFQLKKNWNEFMVAYRAELHLECISNISYTSRLSDLSPVRLTGTSTRFPVESDIKS